MKVLLVRFLVQHQEIEMLRIFCDFLGKVALRSRKH